MIEPDYKCLNGKLIGTQYGDLRRERKLLMERLIFRNDPTVKPRIRQITDELTQILKGKSVG